MGTGSSRVSNPDTSVESILFIQELRRMSKYQRKLFKVLKRKVYLRQESWVSCILKLGPRLNCTAGGMILWDAIMDGNPLIASMLVDAGADLNVKGPGNMTLLHTLMDGKDLWRHRLAMHMMERGAEVNAEDNSDRSVLQCAIEQKVPSLLIQQLLRHGAQVYSVHVMKAIEHPNADKLIPMLVRKLSTVPSKSKHVSELLRRCCFSSLSEDRVLPIVKKLLNKNVPVSSIEEKSSTLVRALQMSKFEVARLLLEYGFDPNEPSQCFITLDHGGSITSYASFSTPAKYDELPLSVAAGSTRTDMVEFLLEAGAKIDALSNYGTALHAACNKQHLGNIQLLLRYGANVNLLDNSNRTPFTVLTSSTCLEQITKQYRSFIRYFVLLRDKKQVVSDQDMNYVHCHSEMQTYFDDCKTELDTIKNTVLLPGFSYYSIFEMNRRELAFQTRSRHFVKKYTNNLTRKLFPKYYDEIRFEFELAAKLRRKLNVIEKLLYKLLLPRLSNLPLERIIYYFYVDSEF
ncbi:serine/threonine-protein phosphatase 6 regulatory ankyrin repeat subunit B-like [Phymastichus coffea]|uniref:serine/threonine-protein phosphatase 6 regulatory ankyrin repeat subunit B-like n=1 Tax=Phymastichus coffea TaxID=108790 RepID=UPI00273BF81D|nr:serine/threonine-protein phosphatase 6 regulatory ankyrin repeat subunit B-like [Phymastichus coffea]